MAFVVPDVGEQLILNILTASGSFSGQLNFHLYVNDYTPVEGTTLSDLTECTDPSYSVISYGSGTWTISTDGSGNTTATNSQQSWTLNGPVDLYGYYCTENTSSGLVLAERFAAPISIPPTGNVVFFTPSIGCS